MSHFNVSLIVWAKSRDSVHKPHFLERKESRSGSNRGPSAYQPSALPLGHTGSQKMTALRARVSTDSTKFLKDHHDHHQSLNRDDRWGTTDDFATSFLLFSLFSTALWDLPNSRPVHSLMLSFHLFLCLPCLLSPFTVPCKMVLARPDEWET